MQPWSQLFHPCWALQPSPGIPTSLRCSWGRQEGQTFPVGSGLTGSASPSPPPELSPWKGLMQDMASPWLVHALIQARRGDTRRLHQVFPFLGLACPFFALPTSRGAQRGLQFPRDQIPHLSQLSGVTASAVPRCWAVLGCLGAEAGNIKTAWAVLARAGAAVAGDCHVCEQKQRGLNMLPPPCPPSSFPVQPLGSQEKGGGGLGECSG